MPDKFSDQIQNAYKLHASLQKVGMEGCFNSVLDCIIIISEESAEVLQEVIDNGTEYSDWKPVLQNQRHRTGNAIVFLK